MDLVHDAKDVAGKVVDQAKTFVADQVTDQQDSAADQIGHIAEALHRSSGELTDSIAGPYVKKAADALERVSHTVRTATLGSIVERTENFARRDPLLFIGGAFTLGLLAARFLKSSAGATDKPLELTDGRTTQPMTAQSMTAQPSTLSTAQADARQRSPRGTNAPTRGRDGNG